MTSESRHIHVLLTLLDGERSFGMSLAQKGSVLGSKYTVVSSVFANSPAARAGVRKGYVVRYINDKPMVGLTVAQVANNFRNVAQAKITLEIVENTASPRTATFEGIPTSSGNENKSPAPITGFSASAASSGRAIAAPGTALAVPKVAAPKQQVLRLGAKPAAKTLATAGITKSVEMEKEMKRPSADSKRVNSVSLSGSRTKVVAPVLRLKATPKSMQTDVTMQKVGDAAKNVALKYAARNVLEMSSAGKQTANSTVPRSPIQAIKTLKSASSAQAKKADVTTTQQKSLTAPPVSSSVPSPLKAAPSPVTKAAAPTPPTKAAVPSSAPTPSKKPAEVATTVPVKAASAYLVAPAGNGVLPQPASTPSAQTSPGTEKSVTVTDSRAHSKGPTSTNAPAGTRTKNSAPPVVPASLSRYITPSVTSVPTVSTTTTLPEPENILPKTTAASTSIPPPPVVIPLTPQHHSSRSAIATPNRSRAHSLVVARSAPVPAAVAPESSPSRTKTSRKRGRSRKSHAVTKGTKGKAKAKRHQMQEEEEALDLVQDYDDSIGLYAFSSDSDLEESPTKKATHRAGKGRRRGVTDRTRQSLTINRLLGMGFTQEDAEASVNEIGDDPDACMVWIISKIEERQFNEDLNRASIQSEESKRAEEQRVKKLEKEVIAQAEKFMSNFTTSYINSVDSNAPNLKIVLESTINQVEAVNYLREILTKLLTLEDKSIKWYKEATRSYMLELAERLETTLGSHDVMTCCSRVKDANAACVFVRKLVEEEKALKKALFEMPTNQGGVPPVFLECDEATKFDLEDDGFEVLDE